MSKIVLRVIGFILITPAILSIPLFILWLLAPNMDLGGTTIESIWLGTSSKVTQSEISFDENFRAVSLLSEAPIYFGLMAIAGAYLLAAAEKKPLQ